MPVKRSKSSKKKSPRRGRKGRGKPKVSLPTQKTELSDDLRDYSILIHGEKKIGKTSLLAEEEDAIFLEWDPEQKAKAIYQVHIPDWAHFEEYVKLLEDEAKAGTLKFRTVVVDGVDLMYNSCFATTCKRLCIEHPNDENDWGKSWGAIKKAFSEMVRRLLNIPKCSVRFICHSTWKEISSRGGLKVEKLVPILSGQAEEVLVGLVDIWAAYTYDGDQRVIVIEGDEETGAGHRVDHCFRTPDGTPVQEIPAGGSSQEAYSNLLRAFANKQPTVKGKEESTKKPSKKKAARRRVVKRKKKD